MVNLPARVQPTPTIEIPAELGNGLFINGYIGNQNFYMLIDTRATVSLVSTRIFRTLPSDLKGNIYQADTRLCTANGLSLAVEGVVVLPITIGFQPSNQQFYVADIETDVLLGLDFLDSRTCSLNIADQVLSCNDVQVPLYNTRVEPSLHRITILETLTIPAQSESIVPGCLPASADMVPGSIGLIEMVPEFSEKHELIVAASVNRISPVVPLRLMNPSESSITVYP